MWAQKIAPLQLPPSYFAGALFSVLISVAPGSEYSSKKLIFEELNPQIL
jgi:hypothetical protein